jgi:hypothetical protein
MISKTDTISWCYVVFVPAFMDAEDMKREEYGSKWSPAA